MICSGNRAGTVTAMRQAGEIPSPGRAVEVRAERAHQHLVLPAVRQREALHGPPAERVRGGVEQGPRVLAAQAVAGVVVGGEGVEHRRERAGTTRRLVEVEVRVHRDLDDQRAQREAAVDQRARQAAQQRLLGPVARLSVRQRQRPAGGLAPHRVGEVQRDQPGERGLGGRARGVEAVGVELREAAAQAGLEVEGVRARGERAGEVADHPGLLRRRIRSGTADMTVEPAMRRDEAIARSRSLVDESGMVAEGHQRASEIRAHFLHETATPSSSACAGSPRRRPRRPPHAPHVPRR